MTFGKSVRAYALYLVNTLNSFDRKRWHIGLNLSFMVFLLNFILHFGNFIIAFVSICTINYFQICYVSMYPTFHFIVYVIQAMLLVPSIYVLCNIHTKVIHIKKNDE